MKVYALVLMSCCAIFWAGSGEAANAYTTRYDNIDVDRILNNNRILTSYIKCMMEEGACTPDAKELKKTLPDALITGCTKCNEKQKAAAEKVIKHLMNKRQPDWERLLKKYDPNGEFKKRFEAEAKKKGVTL